MSDMEATVIDDERRAEQLKGRITSLLTDTRVGGFGMYPGYAVPKAEAIMQEVLAYGAECGRRGMERAANMVHTQIRILSGAWWNTEFHAQNRIGEQIRGVGMAEICIRQAIESDAETKG